MGGMGRGGFFFFRWGARRMGWVWGRTTERRPRAMVVDHACAGSGVGERAREVSSSSSSRATCGRTGEVRGEDVGERGMCVCEAVCDERSRRVGGASWSRGVSLLSRRRVGVGVNVDVDVGVGVGVVVDLVGPRRSLALRAGSEGSTVWPTTTSQRRVGARCSGSVLVSSPTTPCGSCAGPGAGVSARLQDETVMGAQAQGTL
jgi:hypothetical protein